MGEERNVKIAGCHFFFQFWHQLEQANLLAPLYIFGINKTISIVETLKHLFFKCLGKH